MNKICIDADADADGPEQPGEYLLPGPAGLAFTDARQTRPAGGVPTGQPAGHTFFAAKHKPAGRIPTGAARKIMPDTATPATS